MKIKFFALSLALFVIFGVSLPAAAKAQKTVTKTVTWYSVYQNPPSGSATIPFNGYGQVPYQQVTHEPVDGNGNLINGNITVTGAILWASNTNPPAVPTIPADTSVNCSPKRGPAPPCYNMLVQMATIPFNATIDTLNPQNNMGLYPTTVFNGAVSPQTNGSIFIHFVGGKKYFVYNRTNGEMIQQFIVYFGGLPNTTFLVAPGNGYDVLRVYQPYGSTGFTYDSAGLIIQYIGTVQVPR